MNTELNTSLIDNEVILFYVDHTSRFQRNTGIQRCVRCLARAFHEIGISLQPVVWNRQFGYLEPANEEQRLHLAKWNGPSPNQWADGSVPSADGLINAGWLIIAELVSGPYNPTSDDFVRVAMLNDLSLAWLFHDAIPWRLPFLYGNKAFSASQAHCAYMEGLANFELVLANSQNTANHLREFWREKRIFPKGNLLSIPLAEEFPGKDRSLPTDEGDIVLCVGSLEPRKNHCALIKALADLVFKERWPDDIVLVLVGWPNDREVVALVERALKLCLPLRWESQADDALLEKLYRDSLFCIFPSIEEGFGLPVAESLWHHRSCICSQNGAISELASGGGCLTVDTTNWHELRDALERLLIDKNLRNELQNQITKRPVRLWQNVAFDWFKAISESKLANT